MRSIPGSSVVSVDRFLSPAPRTSTWTDGCWRIRRRRPALLPAVAPGGSGHGRTPRIVAPGRGAEQERNRLSTRVRDGSGAVSAFCSNRGRCRCGLVSGALGAGSDAARATRIPSADHRTDPKESDPRIGAIAALTTLRQKPSRSRPAPPRQPPPTLRPRGPAEGGDPPDRGRARRLDALCAKLADPEEAEPGPPQEHAT